LFFGFERKFLRSCLRRANSEAPSRDYDDALKILKQTQVRIEADMRRRLRVVHGLIPVVLSEAIESLSKTGGKYHHRN